MACLRFKNRIFMKNKFIPLLLSALALTGCGRHAGEGHEAHGEETREHAADEIVLTREQLQAAGISTETVRPGSFSEVIHVGGQVLPAQGSEVTVSATMAGIVTLSGARLTEGAPVAKSQPLFSISAREMADGNPAAAAQAELEAARKDYARAEALAADRLISARELEQVWQRLETATSTARSLGGASRSRAVTAPMGGYVKNLLVKTGDYVAPGQPLATITGKRTLQLRAEVPERYYRLLPQISGANFRLSGDAGTTVRRLSDLRGRLVSRGQSAEDGSNFVPVIFEFDNVGDIVAGGFADVYLMGRERAGVISVPRNALAESQGLYYVYVRLGGHSFRKVEVRAGDTDGARVEITAGLHAGDVVVTKGVTQVKLAAAGTAVPEGHSH